MNKQKILTTIFALTFLVLTLNLASALVVDADYVTIYPGESGSVKVDVDNTFNFDIEDVSIALVLDNVPFTSVGSSEKNLDDLDSEDDDSVTFTILASTDIVPGDYNIPYVVKYTNAENSSAEQEEKTGSFGLRVSAKTNIDFSVETKDNIVGKQGRISLKIVNKGLGAVKFVSVKVSPQGYELISSRDVYVGTIDSDDSDTASFDVVFKTTSPMLTAIVTYNDFDNNAKTETINLPVNVYTTEKALELGLITKPNYTIYFAVGGVLIVWFVWRKIKKRRKRK
ncbi:MAG: hypothetical protein ABH967_02225 [Patescibacteria group bacterium]